LKWAGDLCQVKGPRVAKVGTIEEGYKRSSIHVVGGRSYRDIPMVDIIFLISQDRYN
jgi:hypothetical protein